MIDNDGKNVIGESLVPIEAVRLRPAKSKAVPAKAERVAKRARKAARQARKKNRRVAK